jgi:hypothetical protein
MRQSGINASRARESGSDVEAAFIAKKTSKQNIPLPMPMDSTRMKTANQFGPITVFICVIGVIGGRN